MNRSLDLFRCKTVPTVDVPGHGIQYKSTLVKLLNEDPKLSNKIDISFVIRN
jgi:hypothetical protein